MKTFSINLMALIIAVSGQETPQKSPGLKFWEEYSVTFQEREFIKFHDFFSDPYFKRMYSPKRSTISLIPSEYSYLREFKSKNENRHYLVLKTKKMNDMTKITVVLKRKNNNWIIDDIVNKNCENEQDVMQVLNDKKRIARIKEEITSYYRRTRRRKLIKKLKKIWKFTTIYYHTNINREIVESKKIGLTESDFSYIHPVSEKKLKILFTQPGNEFSESSYLILAITEKPVEDGFHFAVFEDGKVLKVAKGIFHYQALRLGLKENYQSKLDKNKQDELDKLISILSSSVYTERNNAKLQILKNGPEVISYILQRLDKADIETKLTLKEILKKLYTESLNKSKKL